MGCCLVSWLHRGNVGTASFVGLCPVGVPVITDDTDWKGTSRSPRLPYYPVLACGFASILSGAGGVC